jgi:hypothetical protein
LEPPLNANGELRISAEIDALAVPYERQMEVTPRAATCSLERPMVLKLSNADIEKMFWWL